MPDAAEIVALVLELDHRRDHRRFGQTLELGIFDRLAEFAGEGELLARRRLLVAQEDHEMVEEGLAHLAHDVVVEVLRDVDAMKLGAQRAGDRPDFDVAVIAHCHSFAHGGSVLAMKWRMPSAASGRRSRPTRLLAASSSTARSSCVAQDNTSRFTADTASGSSFSTSSRTAFRVRLISAVLAQRCRPMPR